MTLVQFWRILWARRWLILGTTVFCFLGGVAAIIFVPPRWKADAHVYLNILKPDPVTGEVISGPATRSYVATQMDLVTDYSVVGPTVDKLGWLTDPNLIQRYQDRSSNDTRDFRHWAAQFIVDQTKADVSDGSNILDITYTGPSAEAAKAVADALMDSYIEASLAFKRADAIKSADWDQLQAAKTKSQLEAAQADEAAFERANNVVMQDDKTDFDSARLAAMAGAGANDSSNTSNIDQQLAEVDAQIKDATATLGPNHPDLLALQSKRSALAALSAREHSNLDGGATRLNGAKALVISKRDKLAQLRNLQSQVAILRDLYDKTVQKEADFRQQAAVTDAGLTALGHATVPASPSFPNLPLIFGGSIALGVLMGGFLALLIELLNRRVRSAEDLRSSMDVPLLTILQAAR